jgi:hypothetical protein
MAVPKVERGKREGEECKDEECKIKKGSDSGEMEEEKWQRRCGKAWGWHCRKEHLHDCRCKSLQESRWLDFKAG